MNALCEDSRGPEVSLSLGTAIAACAVFLMIFPFIILNFRVVPLGSLGGVVTGAFLMSAIVIGPAGLYTTVGDHGNIRVIFLSLGTMILAQYFQREDLFARLLKRILKKEISFSHFLCRVTFATFLLSGLFSSDSLSHILTPVVLQIWQDQKRPFTQIETLLIGIATSANIGSVLTVWASVPVAVIASRTAHLSGQNRLDMVSTCVYLSLPAFLGYTLNLVLLLCYFKLKPTEQTDRFQNAIIELQDVEQSLITPNAIIDQIVQEEGPSATDLGHSCSTNSMKPPQVKKKHKTGDSSKSVEFLDISRSRKISLGDINAKGVQAQGPSSMYVGRKEEVEGGDLNKDQCHSLYNLDKIGYIAVSERHGKDDLGMPRTISFYHSFSDLDSWRYTRESVVHRFEQDHPRKVSLLPLTRRRMSSRGRLESVQFNRISTRRRPRQRQTSVLCKGLVSDALLLLPKLGMYKAFSGLSPSAQFLTGRREDVARMVDIVHEEFVQSQSRLFRVFLILVFGIMVVLFFVRLPSVNLDIGILPVGSVVVVILVDAIWNRRNCTLIFRRLNWSVIINYFALFVFVKGLTASNLPLWIWRKMDFVSHSFNNVISVVLITCLAVFFTHVFGAVTLTLIVLDIPTCSPRLPQLLYLAWCSVIASNMTLHGSASNLMVSHKAGELIQHEISYWNYLRYGFLSSLVILVMGEVVIGGMIGLAGETGVIQ